MHLKLTSSGTVACGDNHTLSKEYDFNFAAYGNVVDASFPHKHNMAGQLIGDELILETLTFRDGDM